MSSNIRHRYFLPFTCITLFVVSCTTTSTAPRSVPLEDVFLSIHNEPYVLHKNDCSNKAAKYARALCNKKYPAQIAIFRPKEGCAQTHAVVSLTYANGETWYYCPTSNTVSSDGSRYGRLIVQIPYNIVDLSAIFGIPREEFDIVEDP